jgi:hypothetical protein
MGQKGVARGYEYICFCPKCKTFETLWFFGDRLVPTKKFYQNGGGLVYHNCGSKQPCKLLSKYIMGVKNEAPISRLADGKSCP